MKPVYLMFQLGSGKSLKAPKRDLVCICTRISRKETPVTTHPDCSFRSLQDNLNASVLLGSYPFSTASLRATGQPVIPKILKNSRRFCRALIKSCFNKNRRNIEVPKGYRRKRQILISTHPVILLKTFQNTNCLRSSSIVRSGTKETISALIPSCSFSTCVYC